MALRYSALLNEEAPEVELTLRRDTRGFRPPPLSSGPAPLGTGWRRLVHAGASAPRTRDRSSLRGSSTPRWTNALAPPPHTQRAAQSRSCWLGLLQCGQQRRHPQSRRWPAIFSWGSRSSFGLLSGLVVLNITPDHY